MTSKSMAQARVSDRLTDPQGVDHVQSLVQGAAFGRVGGLPERGVLRFRWNSRPRPEPPDRAEKVIDRRHLPREPTDGGSPG